MDRGRPSVLGDWGRRCVRCVYALLVLLEAGTWRAHAASIATSPSTSALNYLEAYGYLKPQDAMTGALRSEEYVIEAIKHFQKMAGIPQTGQVDDATKKMMETPRCGVADNIELGRGARRKRYALQGSKWAKSELTYTVSAYPSNVARYEVDEEIQKALKVWADVTPLKFIKMDYGRADLDIRFVRRSHGDGNPFDGKGRTLAHAFFPQYGGDAHFDEEEEWTISLPSGVNLFQVAAHEFGHSLGLSHSDVSTALMAPFYRGYQRHFELDNDDVWAAQELYGKPQGDRNTPPPTVPPYPRGTRGPPVNVPAICRNPSVDAIVMNADGRTYIFKGTEYYRLNDYGIDDGYPRTIADDWGGLQGPVDSALHWDNGYTFIFKGDFYWKFYNLNLIYVRRISEGFKGVPENVDASFVWGGNGKTYFIKGDQYWRYTENSIDRGYPRPLSVWSGLPSRIDAAIKWRNGRTYFFSGSEYYRYNDVEFNIDKSYPRRIGNWWLGCPDEASLVVGSRSQVGTGTGSDLVSRSQVGTQGSASAGTSGGIQSVANNKDEQFVTVSDTRSQQPPKNCSSLVETCLTSTFIPFLTVLFRIFHR